MVSIDPKALEHACLCAGRSVHHFDRMGDDLPLRASIVAHARAIERLEAIEARLTEALRAAEEREKALLSALEEWMFRYFWRVDGMPVDAARIHAQSRMKIAVLAGAKPC